MVFYRKYRPQTINELDSVSVRETLYAVLQKNIPHAFLFTGPKGLGKTSTARIVAKVVNCEERAKGKGQKKNEGEPCNKCNQCLSITNGTNMDVLEIDAASNRGIDEIRELKEKIRLSPVAALKKVYIIDEVHMLTTEAFNALLKTLEEPPDHAMFILCTTEPQKVPATIMSRCFHIQFKPATEEEIVRSFKRIVTGEKIDITDDALRYIAQLADRGFRDGVKILEEITLLANGKKITRELTDSYYKTVNIGMSAQGFLFSLHEMQAKKCLAIINQMTEQGTDMRYFINYIIDLLHNILLLKIGVAQDNKSLLDAYGKFDIDEIKKIIELMSKAYNEMRTAVLPQLPLELGVITWTDSAMKTVKPDVQSTENVQIRSHQEEDGVSVSSLRKQVGTIKKIKALYGEKTQTQEVEVPEDKANLTVELLQTSGDGIVTQEWIELFWNNFINEMKKYNHTVAGVLRGCTIKSYANQQLVIQTAYKFHKERLDDLKNRASLLKISKLLTGKDVEITVELKK